MLTSSGHYIFDYVSETGKVYFTSLVSETGDLAIKTNDLAYNSLGDVVLNIISSPSVSGGLLELNPVLSLNILAEGNIFSHNKAREFNTLSKNILISKSETYFDTIDLVYDDALEENVLFKYRIKLTDNNNNDTIVHYIDNPDKDSRGGFVAQGNTQFSMAGPVYAGIVTGGGSEILRIRSLEPIGEIVAHGETQRPILFRSIISSEGFVSQGISSYSSKLQLDAMSGMVMSGSKTYSGARPSIEALAGIVSDGKSIINKLPCVDAVAGAIFNGNSIIGSSSYITTKAGMILGQDSEAITSFLPGYVLKSNGGLVSSGIAFRNQSKVNVAKSGIVTGSLTIQEGLSHGRRPFKINKYPFISTNALDEIAIYLSITRLPGETDEKFAARIKRLAKVKYGVSYETSTESINEQIGRSLQPILRVTSEWPFTIDIQEEYIEIKVYNYGGQIAKYVKVFTNIMNTLDENGNTIYSPLMKLIERKPVELDIEILNNDLLTIPREHIFKAKNYNTGKYDIISKHRHYIKTTSDDYSLLPGSIYNDSQIMRRRSNSLLGVDEAGKYYLNEDINYLETFTDSFRPFQFSFTEYKKSFIIKKADITMIPLVNTVKHGISDNFINLLELLLDGKVIE